MLSNIFRYMTMKYPFVRGRSKLTQIYSNYFNIKEGTVVSLDNDLEIEIYPKQFVSKQIYLFGKFEPLEIAVFMAIVKQGMVVFDVGANIGQYTLLAAKCVGSNGRVYAFEPSSENNKILMRNLERNRFLDHVIVSKTALTSTKGIGKLLLSEDGGSNCISSTDNIDTSEKTEEIEFNTIDSVVSSNNLHKIDVIKIDVEGADLEVLKGAENTLKEFGPILFVEFAERFLQKFGTTPNEMLKYLKSLEYKPYKFTSAGFETLKKSDDINNRNLLLCKYAIKI